MTVPVTIITGFLGAGKTTLVNTILKGQHGLKIAVIENEFGEVGVDDALVIATKEEFFEMNNGCICCTVRGDLIRILTKLAARPTKLDAVVIETTGLADPGPVAQTFFVDSEVRAAFTLDAIVTVVDCRHAEQHLDEEKPEGVENESIEQVAFADRILLNKTDLVSEAAAAALTARLRRLNPHAEIIPTQHCAVDPLLVIGLGAFDLARVCDFDAGFLDTEGEHQHDASVTSVGIMAAGELDLGRASAWLAALVRAKGEDIFRCKGVLAVRGSERLTVFQGVHMMLDFGVAPQREWAQGEPRINRLIFIGRGLDRKSLEDGFKRCLLNDNT